MRCNKCNRPLKTPAPSGYDKKLKPIKNINDLWRLIEESRVRA